MEVINLKAVTTEVLNSVAGIKKVATDYPSTWNVFPTAIYRTASKTHQIDANGQELQTFWTITIELYGTGSLTEIANDVVETFKQIGFTGTIKDANTAELKRVIIEVSAVVDNVTKYVFTK